MTDEPLKINDAAVRLVAVESQGGVYDDRAFMAGYFVATVAAAIQFQLHDVIEMRVDLDLVDQVDLIAMKYGWVIVTKHEIEHDGNPMAQIRVAEARNVRSE